MLSCFTSENISSLRTTLNRRRRNGGAVFSRFQKKADIDKLVRPQRLVFVIKDSFQLAGAGGLINLIVDSDQLACREFGLVIAAVCIHFERALRICCDDGLQLVFRQGEDTAIGCKLGNDEHAHWHRWREQCCPDRPAADQCAR